MARDFFIQLPGQDNPVLVEFQEDDDLVVLIGDGVNQYVNSKIAGSGSSFRGFQLRAVPHALSIQQNQQQARVWYGRMVLPPATAIHPEHGMTFGKIRENSMNAQLSHQAGSESFIHLGCSGDNSIARQLEETSCEKDSLFCWNRCMNLEEHGVSDSICASQELSLRCINPRGQLWDDVSHGDFFPACIDEPNAVPVTPFPEINGYPRDETVCSDKAFAAFVQAQKASGGYDHSESVGELAAFLWSVVQKENATNINVAQGKVNTNVSGNSIIKGELVANSLFSWISIGLRGDKDFAMEGSHVLVAMNGGNYTPSFGFDMSMDPTFNEHVIGDSTPFRLWNTPIPSSDMLESTVNVDNDECFVSLSFQTGSFAGKPLNISGEDKVIWAANGKDSFMQYHGHDLRGVFNVHWNDGTVKLSEVAEGDDKGVDNDYDHGSGGGDHKNEGASAATGPMSFALSFTGFLISKIIISYMFESTGFLI